MKNKFLKVSIILNLIYFFIGCGLVYLEYGMHYDFFLSAKSWKEAFYDVIDSPLIEEWGIISYVIAVILSLLMLSSRVQAKVVWAVMSLIPVIVFFVIVCNIRLSNMSHSDLIFR